MNLTFRRHGLRVTLAAAVLSIAAVLTMGSACEKALDDAFRVLGTTPGTFYNYGADGQIVFEAQCASMHFTRDTTYDVYNSDMKLIEPSSVIAVSCGDNLISTVGFTSVYISNGAKASLAANSQQYADVKIKNNDRGIPLINYLWRDIKNVFVGTSQVVQVCDQNNNPILAFAAEGVTGYATDVAKSTMFKLDPLGNKPDGYVWVSRASYTRIDAKLLDSTSF